MGWNVRESNAGGDVIFRTCPDRPWGLSSLLYNGYLVFPEGKSGRGVTLTTHLCLVPRSWKIRAIPLLPLWDRVACYRVKPYLTSPHLTIRHCDVRLSVSWAVLLRCVDWSSNYWYNYSLSTRVRFIDSFVICQNKVNLFTLIWTEFKKM